MLQEFEYLKGLESEGMPRGQAEVLVSAGMEATRDPQAFQKNKSYWIYSLEKGGFPSNGAEAIVAVLTEISKGKI